MSIGQRYKGDGKFRPLKTPDKIKIGLNGIPKTGWLIHEVKRVEGRVHVTMIHDLYPYVRYINAPDESTSIAWTMLLRGGRI